jgi:hypothetical protein
MSSQVSSYVQFERSAKEIFVLACNPSVVRTAKYIVRTLAYVL